MFIFQLFKVHNRQGLPGDVNCDNSSTKSELPDPYDELTDDGRKFVDAIADMGFPRAQVSRTVKHLGIDEKAVCVLFSSIYNSFPFSLIHEVDFILNLLFCQKRYENEKSIQGTMK